MTFDAYEKLFNDRINDCMRMHSYSISTLRAILQGARSNTLHSTASMLLCLQTHYSLDNKLFWYAYGFMKFRVNCKNTHDTDGDTAFISMIDGKVRAGFSQLRFMKIVVSTNVHKPHNTSLRD